MPESKSKTTLVVAMLIVGLVIGGLIGYGSGNSTGKDKGVETVSAKTDTKAANLRVVMNNLNAEHANLASAATRAGFDGDPMFKASAEQLDKNSVEISKAVGSVYGKEAEAKFLEIWRSHITFFVNYTVAAKAGDMAGMEKAVSDLNGYVSAVSDLLGGATGLPKEAVASLISEHVGLLKSAVDKHAAGDYAGSYEAEKATRDQITTKVADTLAGAIVKQSPDKFTN